MIVSTCPSMWSTEMRLVRTTSAALFAAFASPKEYPSKRSAPRWLFGRADGGRALANIRHMDGGVLDVDQGAVPCRALAEALADVHAIIASTYSASTEIPRWRVIVPFDRSVSVEEYPRVWRAVAELVEHVATPDLAGKSPAHIWSTPARPVGGWFHCQETEGAVFSTAAALERFPEPVKVERSPDLSTIHSASRYARGALQRAAETIAASQRGERNHVLNQQAFPIGRFVVSGELDEQEVIDVLATSAMSAGVPRLEATYTVRRAIRERLRRSA